MRRLAPFLLLLAFAAAGRADPPSDRTVRYAVHRNGDRIGTHEVRFATSGARTQIHHRLELRVRVLALEAYRYTMDRRETWEGDRFLGMATRTDKNGEALSVFARLGGNAFRVRTDHGEWTAPSGALPATPHHDVFDQPVTRLIHAEHGQVLSVSARRTGEEPLRLGQRTVPCRRVRIEGDLDATLWFDAQGVLVQKRQRAPDGSTVLTRAL